MRLFSRKVFLLGLVGALACNDVSAPPPLPADFVLANINGRALPTFISPIPEGPTILSATLRLDGSGKAILTESLRDMVQGDVMVLTTLDYVITGNQIRMGCFVPSPANLSCPEYTGTITETTLSLALAPNGSVVYNFTILPRTAG